MAALNMQETENLSLAERAMSDAVARLRRASGDDAVTQVTLDLDEVGFIIENLTKAKSLVNTVKQMKGYYPK